MSRIKKHSLYEQLSICFYFVSNSIELSTHKQGMSDKAEVRRVSEADYDVVMSIRSGVYGGYDYLPSMFKSLITQSHNKGYASIINGKFVAFCMVSKVDGGKTVVTRAGRVNKQYEGRGLYNALKLYLQKHVFSDGTISSHTVVYDDTNQSMMDKTSKGEFTLLMKRKVIGYRIDFDKMSVIAKRTHTTTNTRTLNEVDLITVFKSRSVCSTLFPQERIICNFVPYRLTERNIPLIFSEVSLIVGTGEPELSFITCGVYYRSENGHTFIIEVYGNNNFIREHLILHFQHALQYYPKEINILIMCKENAADKIDSEIKECQLSNMDVGFKTVFLVEKNIK
ncbi:putative N-acetyltransferase 16 isoform X1 [Mytilus galloprovincialis]|uniref:putative N-acetyltransferase 16 isoform X1 n=2 Tax=Mytilus galloprovincialis TaxID=29158 RepID=UPI003F7B8A64